MAEWYETFRGTIWKVCVVCRVTGGCVGGYDGLGM